VSTPSISESSIVNFSSLKKGKKNESMAEEEPRLNTSTIENSIFKIIFDFLK